MRDQQRRNPYNRKIAAARMEEDRLRQEGLGLYDQTIGMMEDEQKKVQRDLRSGVDRAASQSFGRGLGRARSGGALRGQSQLEMDLRRQAGEARRAYQTDLQQTKADKLAFERKTMKSSAQLQKEMGDHKAAVKQLYDDYRTLGVLNNTDFNRRVDAYINRMGLTDEEAFQVKEEQNTLVENEPFFW